MGNKVGRERESNMSNVIEVINELCQYDSEREWFEFNENWYKSDELGEYISAPSNSAAYEGRKQGYFIWGVNDKTHEIVGTDFNCNQDVKNEPLKHYLARQLTPDVNFKFEEEMINGKRLVMLTIPSAKSVPTAYARERYRIGSSKENLRKFPEKESYLFNIMSYGFPTMEKY